MQVHDSIEVSDMRMKSLIAILAFAVPGFLLAQDNTKYQCSYGELQRRVEIYTEPGMAVPCEVHYFKDTEAPGASEVLWNATNDATYCAAKAEEFVAKLEGWGWDCATGAAESEPMPDAEAMPEADVQDDTDVLSPGGPSGD